MSVNTFLLLLLVIANYTNLFLNIKNRRKWNAYYLHRFLSRKPLYLSFKNLSVSMPFGKYQSGVDSS